VKAIYSRLKEECPRFEDQIDMWDDGIKLAHLSAKDCILFSRMVDAVEWQRGYEAILAQFTGENDPGYTYQFGTEYTSG